MAIFIIVLFLVCGLLFVWEAIIAPSIRLQLRFQMFTERDRLRALHAAANSGVDSEVLNYAHQYVNAGINCIHSGNVFRLVEAQMEFRRNKALQDQMDAAVRLFDKSNNAELRSIINRILKTGIWAVLVNSTFVIIFAVFATPLITVIPVAVRVQRAVANFFWILAHQSGHAGAQRIASAG